VNAVGTVIDAVRRVEFGPLTTFRNLSLLALSAADQRGADYLTLDEALERHSVHIVEVSEGGHVPELKIVNEGKMSVLLLDGEELLGAKQNRIINLTILAPAHRTCVVPVSCVESGRWRHVSRGFAAAPRAQFAEGRAEKMRHVTSSLRQTGAARRISGKSGAGLRRSPPDWAPCQTLRPCRRCMTRAMLHSMNSWRRSRQLNGKWAQCFS
jgi:hypothetical protein